MIEKQLKFAKDLLDKLVDLDKLTHGAYYDMGRILHTLKEGSLYDLLGYEGMPHLVEEELSFGYTTACKYAELYRRLRELKYNKNESMQLLHEFGLTNLMIALRHLKTKAGKRAIQNRIDAHPRHQVNFILDDEQYTKFEALMDLRGAVRGKSGRRENSSEVFM